jgi:hypothetical protein
MYWNRRRAMLAAATFAFSLLCVVYGPPEAQAACSVSYSSGGTVATCSGTTETGAACAWRVYGAANVCSRHAGPGRPKQTIRVTPAMRPQIQVR